MSEQRYCAQCGGQVTPDGKHRKPPKERYKVESFAGRIFVTDILHGTVGVLWERDLARSKPSELTEFELDRSGFPKFRDLLTEIAPKWHWKIPSYALTSADIIDDKDADDAAQNPAKV